MVHARGPDGPRLDTETRVYARQAGRSARGQRRRSSPIVSGSRSREGPHRGVEILGFVLRLVGHPKCL
jgi:hypothetical protein